MINQLKKRKHNCYVSAEFLWRL